MTFIVTVISAVIYLITLILFFISLSAKNSATKMAEAIKLKDIYVLEERELSSSLMISLNKDFDKWCIFSGVNLLSSVFDFSNEYIDGVFRHYFIVNAGLFLTRLMAPMAVRIYSSFLSFGAIASLLCAVVNAFMGNWVMTGIGGVCSLYILLLSNLPSWYPLMNNEDACLKRSMLNFRLAKPKEFKLITDSNTYVKFYVRARKLGFAYVDSLNNK